MLQACASAVAGPLRARCTTTNAMPPPPPPPQRAATTIQIHFDRKVGQGSYASIYKAKDTSNGHVMAAKVIEFPHKSSKAVDTLTNELETCRSLPDHPNVCRVVDLIRCDDYVALVTDFCNAGDLYEPIAQNTMDLRCVLSYMRQAAAAVAHLHAHDVAHLDVKPENLCRNTPLDRSYAAPFLFGDEPDIPHHSDEIKLVDFGFATRTTGTPACRGRQPGSFGTLPYLAPCAIPGDFSAEVRAELLGSPDAPVRELKPLDVWALGVVFFALMTKSFPWERACVATQREFQNLYYRGLRGVRERAGWRMLSDDVVHLLADMFAIDPLQRVTMDEVIRRLDLLSPETLMRSQAPAHNKHRATATATTTGTGSNSNSSCSRRKEPVAPAEADNPCATTTLPPPPPYASAKGAALCSEGGADPVAATAATPTSASAPRRGAAHPSDVPPHLDAMDDDGYCGSLRVAEVTTYASFRPRDLSLSTASSSNSAEQPFSDDLGRASTGEPEQVATGGKVMGSKLADSTDELFDQVCAHALGRAVSFRPLSRSCSGSFLSPSQSCSTERLRRTALVAAPATSFSDVVGGRLAKSGGGRTSSPPQQQQQQQQRQEGEQEQPPPPHLQQQTHGGVMWSIVAGLFGGLLPSAPPYSCA